jgi:hypothetical protein
VPRLDEEESAENGAEHHADKGRTQPEINRGEDHRNEVSGEREICPNDRIKQKPQQRRQHHANNGASVAHYLRGWIETRLVQNFSVTKAYDALDYIIAKRG